MIILDAFSPYKYINHIDRFMSLAKGEDIIPVMIELDLINLCNHDCIWCTDSLHSALSLEENFAKNLLQEFRDIGVKSVLFKGGGEPLLYPKFENILKYCKEVGLKVAIISNFSVADERIIDVILDTCEGIRISLDAVDKEEYERTHRPKSNDCGFDKVLSNISYLVKNKKNKEILIGINFCFDSNHLKLAPRAVMLGKKLGVGYIGLRRVLFEERLLGVKNIENGVKNNDFDAAKDLGEKLKIPVLVDSFHGKEIKQETISLGCFASPLSAVVCANKHVYPCCALRYRDEFDFGEIKEHFIDVWRGKRRKEVLRKISKMQCAKLCGYRYNYFNEIIQYLKLNRRPHGDFI